MLPLEILKFMTKAGSEQSRGGHFEFEQQLSLLTVTTTQKKHTQWWVTIP